MVYIFLQHCFPTILWYQFLSFYYHHLLLQSFIIILYGWFHNSQSTFKQKVASVDAHITCLVQITMYIKIILISNIFFITCDTSEDSSLKLKAVHLHVLRFYQHRGSDCQWIAINNHDSQKKRHWLRISDPARSMAIYTCSITPTLVSCRKHSDKKYMRTCFIVSAVCTWCHLKLHVQYLSVTVMPNEMFSN